MNSELLMERHQPANPEARSRQPRDHYMTMDGKALQAAFGSISDGTRSRHGIQDVRVKRVARKVYIDSDILTRRSPILAAGRLPANRSMSTERPPGITDYHVRARSASATQIVFTALQVPAAWIPHFLGAVPGPT